MAIEFTNKPGNQNEENKLTFNDVFGKSSQADDTAPRQYDTSKPLVALFHWNDLADYLGKPAKSNSTVAQQEMGSKVQQEKSNPIDVSKRNSELQRVSYSEVQQGKGCLTERIVASISSHEGGFTAINNNDAGYGISVGIRQWNQKSGELPNLIRAWHDKHPSKFKQIFGDYTPNLLNEKWVRDYDMANDGQFMNAMKNALADKDLQRVQMEDAHRFVNNTSELAKKYGFQSEFGMALVCDMVNQLGPTGTERTLAKCGIRKEDGMIDDEHDAALRISRVRPDGKRFHNLLAQRFSPVLPGVTLA
jgi:hypothetical protein